MNILRMQLTLPPVPGGMEQHVRRLTNVQRHQGHHVTLLFAEGAPEHADDHRVGRPRVAAVRPQALRTLLFLLACFPHVWRSRASYDVVHVHGDWSMAIIGWITKRIVRAQLLVLSVHGGALPSRVRAWLQRISFFLPDMIHTTGRREASQSLKGAWVLWQPSGVSDAFLAPVNRGVRFGKGELLVVTMGILRPKKNIDLVLDIAEKMPGSEFVIIGDGPERKRLEILIVQRGLQNVQMIGRCESEEIIAWLDQADVLLCVSQVEGTPTTFFEAMSRGVPVVTSNCGDFDGIIDEGTTGFVIDSFNPQSYIDALYKIGNVESDRGEEIRGKCRERASAFSWVEVGENISNHMIAALSSVESKRCRCQR